MDSSKLNTVIIKSNYLNNDPERTSYLKSNDSVNTSLGMKKITSENESQSSLSKNVAKTVFNSMINTAAIATLSHCSALQKFVLSGIQNLNFNELRELGEMVGSFFKYHESKTALPTKTLSTVKRVFEPMLIAEPNMNSEELRFIVNYNRLQDVMTKWTDEESSSATSPQVRKKLTKLNVFSAKSLELDKDIYEDMKLERQVALKIFDDITFKSLFASSNYQFAIQKLALNNIQNLNEEELKAFGDLLREYYTGQVTGVDKRTIAKTQSLIRQLFEPELETHPGMNSNQLKFISKYNQLKAVINNISVS